MQVLETVEHLCCVVNHSLLNSLVVLPDLAQKSASLDVLEFKVQILLILEAAVNVHQERTLWHITALVVFRELLV